MSEPVFYPGGDSVLAGPSLLISGDTSGGYRLPVTTAACTMPGGFVCCGWLQLVMRGVGPMAPPISVRGCTTVLNYLDCVHSAKIRRTPAGDWVTVSRNSPVVSGYCVFWLAPNGSDCDKDVACFIVPACAFCGVSTEFQLVLCGECVHYRLPVTLGVAGSVMTVVGSVFRCELQTSWNMPKSYVDWESPGVVKLDTSVVPDVLGLRAFYDDAKSVQVLPGRAQNRVLVPDARAKPQSSN